MTPKSQWSHLGELCSLLDVGEISPQEAVERRLPHVILHLYACDCASRGLTTAANFGLPADPRSLDALRAKEAWLHGQGDLAALDAARRDNFQLLSLDTPVRHQLAESGNVSIAAHIVNTALSPNAETAVVLVLRAVGDVITAMASGALSWERLVDQQLHWERKQLSRRLQFFLRTHSRFLWVLSQRRDRLEERIGSFQMQLEDVLY